MGSLVGSPGQPTILFCMPVLIIKKLKNTIVVLYNISYHTHKQRMYVMNGTRITRYFFDCIILTIGVTYLTIKIEILKYFLIKW